MKLNRKDDSKDKKKKKKKSKSKRKALLLGVGLDNEDGHTRVTTGENFHLVGGSKDTHGSMQEKAIKFNEELSRRGKRMEDLSMNEFVDLAHKAKFHEK